jgi:hypothetical protein
MKTVGYLVGGALALSVGMSMQECSKGTLVEPPPKIIDQIEQLEAAPAKPASYLSTEGSEPFPGARNTARRLMTSTRETPGRAVIATSAEEQKFRNRPVSTAKGINASEYDYLSGNLGANKYVMRKI